MTIARTAGLLRRAWPLLLLAVCFLAVPGLALGTGDAGHKIGGEANLALPDLGSAQMLGTSGRTLLFGGMGVCVLGLVFGLVIFQQLKNMPVHSSMKEVSELIYVTCKTYLRTQGKFIMMLWVFMSVIMMA